MENQLQLKNQNTAVTIRQQGRIFLLTDLETELKNLNSVEQEIIAARKKGIALCDLNEDEFDAAITGIIFNISVICGCQLPTHEVHVNALEKEFSIFLMDNGYHKLTPEEVLVAFRMHSNFKFDEKHEMYGAIFNIDFAGKVMRQYLGKRDNIDNRLVRMSEETEREKMMEDLDNKRREKIKKQFGLFLEDKIEELDLSDCYMQLAHDGAFANNSGIIGLWHGGKDGYMSFVSGDSSKWNLDKIFEIQKRVVLYLFKQMKIGGMLEIYDDGLKLLHPGFVFPVEEAELRLKSENEPPSQPIDDTIGTLV